MLHYLPRQYSRPVGAAIVALLAIGLGSYYLACRSTIPAVLRRLLPFGRTLLICGLAAAVPAAGLSLAHMAQYPRDLSHPHHYWNDAIATTDCATRLLLQGRNPYEDASITECLSSLHMSGRFTTPLQAGRFAHARFIVPVGERIAVFRQAVNRHVRRPAEFASNFNYPAGAFLLPAPFVALGWHDLSTFYLVWLALSYVLLARLAPRPFRLWLPLFALATPAVWEYAVHGFSEGLVVFLLLAAWSTWRRPWLSAVLMGAAIATRQDAWLFALFYIILAVRSEGPRAATQRAAVMAAIFAAFNLPFIVLSPGAWLNGVLGPLRDPMFPGGEGLIELVTTGWLPLWPHPVYTILEFAALLACCLLYARTCRRQPGTALVLAVAPLVLAWRSLFVYFFLPLPILCLWPLLAAMARESAATCSASARP